MSHLDRSKPCSDPLSEGPVLYTFEHSEGLIAASETGSWGMILAMTNSISHAITHTCLRNQEAIEAASDLIAAWMERHSIVRFVGCGRALLAASMPGNRMAHGGARVSFMGGMVPLPNSRYGGGLIACSASGETRAVLEAMETARRSNADLKIVGLSRYDARGFQHLCDIFIGIHTSRSEYPNPLSALADTEEHVICGILDALAVIAGRKIHITAEGWREGHEDIGPTGPYNAKGSQSADFSNNGSRS